MNAEQRMLLATQIRNDLIELWSSDPESCLRYLAKRKQPVDITPGVRQPDSYKLRYKPSDEIEEYRWTRS